MPNASHFTKNCKELREAVAALRECSYNVSAAARSLSMDRCTFRARIRRARAFDMIGDEELREPNTPDSAEYMAARARKVAAFQAKQRKGSWDKPVLVPLPSMPFRLKLFGDPHMDSDAFDIDLWEKHWNDMDAEAGVYGVCIGDWFNNWTKSLAHLWKEDGKPSDAWTIFEHYMHQKGAALLAACSGNHDDWTQAPVDPIDLIMKRHGVVYRKGAVRVILKCGEDAVRVSLRHKWKGHSQYSPAHGLRRAAAEGWHDHVMVGGHTHVDEPRMYVQPRSGFVSHLCQLSAFKKFDDYADTHGFRPHSIQPVWDLVISPERDDADPEKIKVFWDHEAAADYLAQRRARVAA